MYHTITALYASFSHLKTRRPGGSCSRCRRRRPTCRCGRCRAERGEDWGDERRLACHSVCKYLQLTNSTLARGWRVQTHLWESECWPHWRCSPCSGAWPASCPGTWCTWWCWASYWRCSTRRSTSSYSPPPQDYPLCPASATQRLLTW